MTIHPDLVEPLKWMPAIVPSKRVLRFLGRNAQKLKPTRAPEGVRISSVRNDGIRARIYRPEGTSKRPGLMWIHGGGLVIGNPKQDDTLCAQTALTLGITVVAVEYRLAPEAPFPAALDDLTDAWQWLQQKAPAWSIDSDRLAIGGESAGGGLAAALAQRLHDEGGHQPVAQWLLAPMLDDRTAIREDLPLHDHPVWNRASNYYAWKAYLGQEPGSESIPPYAAASRREDLSGLPPAWLYAGDIELFYDEVAGYADRLAAAGVDTTFEVVKGAAHGFENWAHSTDLAQALLAKAHAWLADAL